MALTVGASRAGRAMVAAHSGGPGRCRRGVGGTVRRLRGGPGRRPRRTRRHRGAVRRRPPGRRRPGRAAGIATVHDSGAERALVVDVAEASRCPFAVIGTPPGPRLSDLLDPGLVRREPARRLGHGQRHRRPLHRLPDRPGRRRRRAGRGAGRRPGGGVRRGRVLPRRRPGRPARPHHKPVAVLSNLGSAIDVVAADRLRSAGVPVLEGTRSGLAALGHLLERSGRAGTAAGPGTGRRGRRARWTDRLRAGPARRGRGVHPPVGVRDPGARAPFRGSSEGAAVAAARCSASPWC